jgi:hypothetical protein
VIEVIKLHAALRAQTLRSKLRFRHGFQILGSAAEVAFPQLVFGEGSVNGPTRWLEYRQHGGRVGVAPPRRWEAAFRAVACEEVHRRTAGDTLRGRGAFSTRALASRTSQRSGPAHFASHPWERGCASSFAVDPDDRSFIRSVPDRALTPWAVSVCDDADSVWR